MPQILLKPFPIDHQRQDILQHKHNPRPLGLTCIIPPMLRRPLHRDITSRHARFTSIIQLHDHIPFDHDPEVDAGCPVHETYTSGREVGEAQNRAVGLSEAQFPALQHGIGEVEVGVVVQADGHAVGDVEVGGPEVGVVVGFVFGGALHGRLILLVVASDVQSWLRQRRPLEGGGGGGCRHGVRLGGVLSDWT